MASGRFHSWGLNPKSNGKPLRVSSRFEPLDLPDNGLVLPFGNGRSYGDSCLNNDGYLLDTRSLNHFIAFDQDTGILRVEAGVLLADILHLVVPRGWFLPVTPGTRFVTIAGAVANDVHGKNHHQAGTFGCHVTALELLRSDGQRLHCSPDENPEWFAATIGGLGLTGLITWVELQLKPVMNPYLQEETLRFSCLDEFFELNKASEESYEHTVAWVDCMARGSALGRGAFYRANHHGSSAPAHRPAAPRQMLGLPFVPPMSLVNRASLRLFNEIYYRKQPLRRSRTVHYQSFFYPLDSIQHWNRMYGPRGFVQYQCVVPEASGNEVFREILAAISASRQGSFMAVLKVFGAKQSPGLMSFPMPGVTLALDFPNAPATTELLERLDELTRAANGVVYPAKDSRMSAESFQRYFPQWQDFSQFIDPRFSSGFWRRVTGESAP